MLKKIFIGLGVIILFILGYAAMQPAAYTLGRSVVINSTPEKIFPHINSAQKLNEWMPWAAMDPNMKTNFDGPAEGVGSVMAWDSQGDMGVGQSTITESISNSRVRTKIEYYKPMEMNQISDITLTPEVDSTKVTWSVNGENNFIGKIFSMFVNMDKMVGPEFEKGLNTLKAKVENESTGVK